MPRNSVVLATVLLIAGCGQDQTAPGYVEMGQFSPTSDGDRLASWVAGAMVEPEIRSLVMKVMRASPLSEHAVPLNDLISDPEGGTFVGALARAGGETESAVRSLVAALPSLDLYVPAQRDRLAWDGKSSIVVAAMIDHTLPRRGFTPAGAEVTLDLGRALPESPLFLLQFSEHKAYRLEPQAATAGDRIQDPADGEFAAAYIGHLAGGLETIVQVRDLPVGPQGAKYCPPDIPGCPPADGGGGGGDPLPPQPGAGVTSLTGLWTDGECDNGICFEGNEFEFRASSTYGSDVLRIEGVGSSVGWPNINYFIAGYSPSATVLITIGTYETDGWPNPDDHFVYVNTSGHVGDPVLQVTPTSNNGATYPLKKYANVGSGDPVKVYVRYGWTQ